MGIRSSEKYYEYDPHLNVVIPVVVKVEHSIQLWISGNVDVLRCLQAFTNRLSGVFLHLDVVEFPVTKENIKLLHVKILHTVDKQN